MRDTAQRLGLTDFWRWWSGELHGLVPSPLRNALQRRRLHPVLVFHNDVAVLWQLDGAGDAAPEYREAARIPLQGDAGATAQAGRAAIDALARTTGRAGVPRVVIALTPQQVLHKQLTYPSAVEANLDQVLGYDLDRHTPFKSDELYYDAAIVGRDTARSELRIELVAALRSLVDGLRRQASAWGAEVAAVAPVLPQAASTPDGVSRLNLLPAIDRRERPWKRWQMWVPVVLALGLAGAAIAVPLVQKRALAIALLHQTEQARVQAAAADALRHQLEQSVEDYNFVLGRKYAYPSTVQLLDDVTRLLPDDTWLTQLELKTVPRGKEPKREILLRGESGNAGRLVSLLEDSHLFEQAAPRSPTTKIQPGPGEIFDLGAQLKPLAMPAPVPIGLAANTTPATGPGTAAPRPGTPQAQPVSPSSPGSAASSAPAGAPQPAGSASGAVSSSPPAAAPAGPAVSTRTAPAAPAAQPRSASNAPTGQPPPPPSASQGRSTFGPVSSDGRVPGDDN